MENFPIQRSFHSLLSTYYIDDIHVAMADNDKIIKTIELNAPISRVWAALTNFKEFGTWFRVKLDQPFEAGRKSTGNMTYSGHEDVRWVAYIKQIQPECFFSFTWYDSDDGSTAQSADQNCMLVEFQLNEMQNGTQLIITESGFSALPDHRRDDLLQNNIEGWDIQADNLSAYLSK